MSEETKTTKYKVKLKERFLIAKGTIALQFEKPAGFVFRPGQYIDVTLLNPRETDDGGNIRTFSIASAPQDDFLMVATRLRESAFKRQLPDLPIGTAFQIEGPSGSFTLHNNPARAAVFLVGGIGITPVRSILFRAAQDKLPQRIVVLYSNRNPESSAFLEDLTALQKENPNYTLVATMTDMGKANPVWKGETEMIGPELLAKYGLGLPSPIYYVVGPPGMVSGLREMLVKTGVDEDDIRSEDFDGY